MQNFPHLSETSFIKSREQIHSVAIVIGKFREKLVKPIAKNDNLFLKVAQGLCTPPMNDLNELEIGCNIEKQIVEVANNKGKYASVAIKGVSQRELSVELVSVLNTEFEVNTVIDSNGFDSSKTINIQEQDAKDFLIQFTNYAKLLSDFWKRINTGVKTQICLWPHHFDNSFKWFSGRKIEDEDEQMGIGVSNGDETYELPYIYVTFWPPLRKTNTLQIPEGAILHDSDWTGMVLPYEEVMEKKNIDEQKQLIDSFFDVSFASIQRGFTKR